MQIIHSDTLNPAVRSRGPGVSLDQDKNRRTINKFVVFMQTIHSDALNMCTPRACSMHVFHWIGPLEAPSGTVLYSFRAGNKL